MKNVDFFMQCTDTVEHCTGCIRLNLESNRRLIDKLIENYF